MAKVELWPRITTSELAGLCHEDKDGSMCPLRWFCCPFSDGAIVPCDQVTTRDWEDFFGDKETDDG